MVIMTGFYIHFLNSIKMEYNKINMLTSLLNLVKRSPPFKKSRIKYNFPSVWKAKLKKKLHINKKL